MDKDSKENAREDEPATRTHKGSSAGFATKAVHAGQDPENWSYLQVIPPISLSTTFKQRSPNSPVKFDYSRGGNPMRDVLETCLAALEDAKAAFVFSSGMAAIGALSALVKSGERIVCSDDVYGGTAKYFREVLGTSYGIALDMVDLTNLEALERALVPETRMVWIETPTNPLLKIIDIRAVSKLVRGRSLHAVVAVDGTFMTPYFQRPLALGADVVVHSLTKYMNGHSDVVMGCAASNCEQINAHLANMQLTAGAVPSPFDMYLVNRGLKTLHLRMERHQNNAMRLARYLLSHPSIEAVNYPGLDTHPGHAIHVSQASGCCGMISFKHRGGLTESQTFLQELRVFFLAESLGGFESLAELPSLMTHASVPSEERASLGIFDNLVRLSVGIEEYEDIERDVAKALAKAFPGQ
jgi:cystathionine gamma-lyase